MDRSRRVDTFGIWVCPGGGYISGIWGIPRDGCIPAQPRPGTWTGTGSTTHTVGKQAVCILDLLECFLVAYIFVM